MRPSSSRTTHIRLSHAAVALLALILGCGCDAMHLLAVRPDRMDGSKSEAPGHASEAASLPFKNQFRVSQYLFIADFEVKRDLPLFKELTDLRETVNKTLQLPPSNRIVNVYLFEDRDHFERFMVARHPDLPKRRAFFMIPPNSKQLHVYTYWGGGDRIQQDLRHELTHALLHSVLQDVPMWLDEGLAEYFELPPANNGVNAQHVKELCHAAAGPIQPDLARLEKMDRVQDMMQTEYRESWAWTHLMLQGSPEARKVLLGYLRDLRTNPNPGQLRPRLAYVFSVYPSPEIALQRHLTIMDGRLRSTLASY
jgi:hypothetical protein